MEETTIKLKWDTKAALDTVKRQNETYDQAIARIIRKERIAAELREAYRVNAKRDLEICKEWEAIDAPWPDY